MEPKITTKRSFSSRLWRFLVVIIIAFAGLGMIAFYYWSHYYPNGKHVQPDFGGLQKPVFYQGKELGKSAIGEKASLKLPLSVYQDLIDPTIAYEEQSNSVIITTKDKVVRLKTNQLTATINEKPFALSFPAEKNGDTVYLPVGPLSDFYKLKIIESDKSGAVVLFKEGDVVQWGKIITRPRHPNWTAAMRVEPSVRSPVLADPAQGEQVMIWSEKDGWYRIQLSDGYVGYVQKTDIVLDHTETIPRQEQKADFIPWKPTGGKINLTWQQVAGKTPNTAKIGPMPGLNVISPQWFHLADGDGNIQNLADPAYVKWAHARNYQVWALFSNGFEPKQTTAALATYDKRQKMIKQLVSYAQMYELQGINIDFENVYLKDKANVVQFVREAVPFLHEQGLVVSIDVTVKDGSETYSLFLDRHALGQVVDYMIVMAYDEHWSTSPQAGSVASLPWVEKGVTQIMKEDDVPASKLILGVPFYTRLWTEQMKDGKSSVSSKTYSMDAVQKLLQEKKITPALDAETGQDFAQYTEDGNSLKVWLEDTVSVKSRVELVKKYDFAGVASWSRGFETSDIWPLIQDTLEKRP